MGQKIRENYFSGLRRKCKRVQSIQLRTTTSRDVIVMEDVDGCVNIPVEEAVIVKENDRIQEVTDSVGDEQDDLSDVLDTSSLYDQASHSSDPDFEVDLPEEIDQPTRRSERTPKPKGIHGLRKPHVH